MWKFENLIEIEDILNLSEKERIDIVGDLFDLSFDNESISGINEAFGLVS